MGGGAGATVEYRCASVLPRRGRVFDGGKRMGAGGRVKTASQQIDRALGCETA